MKHLFIVNPAARRGNRTTFVTTLIEQTMERVGGDYEIYITKSPLDAVEKITREAAGCDDLRVYACGGDGTINECASACAGRPNVAMACFPCGTGNDFVKLFGSEQDKFKNIAALVDGETSPLDIIRVNDRYALNITSVGLDSRVGMDVHTYDKIPVIGKGKNAYIVSALVNFCRKVTDDLTVTANGQVFQGEMTAVCVCNGTWYGGSFNPVPEARPDDGVLDVLIVRGLKRAQLPMLFLKYGKGRYKELSKYITHVQTTALRIQCAEPFVVNLDGEGMTTDDAKIELLPGGLRFLHPANMRYFTGRNTELTV